MSGEPMKKGARGSNVSGGPAVLHGPSVRVVDGPRAQEVELPSGRLLTVTPGRAEEQETITVRSPTGEVEVSVRFTPDGPKLRFQAADLELDTPGRVSIRCDEYDVSARRGIVMRSGGDVRTEAEGKIVTVAKDDAVHQARSTTIRSTRGDVFIEANDDARIHGERVRLNC
jgi:hypothetical protein